MNLRGVSAGQNVIVETRNYFGATPSNATAWELSYLRRVFTTALKLDVSGIDRKAVGSPCVNAAEIYTPLLTLRSEAAFASWKMREQFESERLRSAIDLLDSERRLVLLGDPGSGKSMFVNMIAVCMAGERLGETCANLERLRQPLPKSDGEPDDAPQPWQHGFLMPVIFTLRDVAAKSLPSQPNAPGTVAHLLRYLEQMLVESGLTECAAPLIAYLKKRGGLIFFDGLDEVPEAERRRSQILRAVEDFADTFARCRILVTCRTYAYHKQEWRVTGFPVAVLSPFGEGQINWFVQRWYQHVAEERGTNRDNWEGRAAVLKHAIKRLPQLRSLAKNPLLLTLMASLHAWRGGSLPDQRAELYDDATEMLLETWVENKIVRGTNGEPIIVQSLEDMLQLPKKEIRTALSRLAFDIHRRQPDNEVGTADISQAELGAALLDICHAKHLDALDLAEHLSDRVGILASHGTGVYSFPHRSFQEYLAACWLTQDTAYPANLAALVRESPERWREVALLAAAKTSEYVGLMMAFVTLFCPNDPPAEAASANDAEAYAALLAAQAIIEAQKRAEPALQDRLPSLKRWLCDMMEERQPTSPLPARERANAGDLFAKFNDDRPGVGCRADGLPWIEWRTIDAGTFLMGSDPQRDPYFEIPYPDPKYVEDFKRWIQDELPQHPVTLPAFRISRYPITNRQFQAFVDDGGYREEKYWTETGGWNIKEQQGWNGIRRFQDERFALPNHPAVAVSWYEAMAFCAWLTSKTTPPAPSPKLGEGDQGGEVIRLPTEAEWEYAARGTDGRLFAFDGEISPEHANYGDTNLGATSAVGCFPRGKSAFECDDMTGNVWEWCLNQFYDYADGEPSADEIKKSIYEEKAKVLRGGAWLDDPHHCRCAYRHWFSPGHWDTVIGFRVVLASRTL